MSDNGDLNPRTITSLITNHIEGLNDLNEPSYGLPFNYAFKIDADLHRHLKHVAFDIDIPINELLARLIQKHYRG
jgi:hypothetical protein